MPRQHLKQREDGRYRCKYGGICFYGATEREALAARDKYKLQQQQGLLKQREGMTVADYAAAWLPVHKAGVDNKCYNDYAKQVNVLIDTIGNMLLHKVTPSDIAKVWLHYLDYSDSTIRRARQLFFSIFDTAADDGYIRTNPMKSEHAKPPKGYSGTHRAITDEERRNILECGADHHFHLAVMVMLYAGLRRGEALALDIDRDVDFINHCIYVRQAVRYDSNQPILDDPKTEAGKRTIPMLSVLQDVLRGHHGLLAKSRKTGGLMSESSFDSAWDGYIRHIECRLNGVKQKRWADSNKPWTVFPVRPHDLRHSYCTMLRDAGVDLKVAMKWMGHADEKMILRIYDHINDARTKSSIDKVEKLLGSAKGSKRGSNQIKRTATR